MSKSIYEEALETIKALHEDWFELNVLHDTFEIPIQALKQAHNQEKLLELYKEIKGMIVRTSIGNTFAIRESEWDRLDLILNKIKENENDK